MMSLKNPLQQKRRGKGDWRRRMSEAGERFRYKNVGRDFRADNVRGCLIMLVVIGHFLLPLYRTRFITNLFFLIYTFHMPCFVMISGNMARGIYTKGRFRWARLFQLFWLYILFEIIVFFSEIPAYGPTTTFPDFFHESGAPWYLLSMCIWYLLIFVMHYFREFPLNMIALTGLTVLCLAGGYLRGLSDFLALDRTIAFAPFFFVGYFMSRDNLQTLFDSEWRKLFIVLGALCAAVLFFGTYDFLGQYQLVVYGSWYERFDPSLQSRAWLIRLIWYGVAFCMSVGLLSFMTKRMTYVFTELGQRTLQIYILHRPIRDLCIYYGLFDHINVHSKLSVLSVVLVSILLTILLSALPFKWLFDFLRTLPERVWHTVRTKRHRKRRGRIIADKYQREKIRQRIESKIDLEEL